MLLQSVCASLNNDSTAIGASIVATVQACSYMFPKTLRGIRRLLFIYLATVVLGVVLMPLEGVNLVSAFIQSNVLAYGQVFGHQVYKQALKRGA